MDIFDDDRCGLADIMPLDQVDGFQLFIVIGFVSRWLPDCEILWAVEICLLLLWLREVE